MSQSNDSPVQARPQKPMTDEEKERSESYRRRIKAAGLSDDENDEGPEDMDEFRYDLARRIVMFLNQWDGCPEPLCKRNRGCMAPSGDCINIKEEPMTDAEWDAARYDIRQAIDEKLAELGLEDE